MAEKPKKKRLGLKITGGVLAALMALGIVNAAIGGDSAGTDPGSQDVASAPVEEQPAAEEPKAEEKKAEEPKAEEPAPAPEVVEDAAPEMTVSQENAVRSAESYLDFKGFSRKGLIQQLSSEYGEGFSKADATFAVDYLEDTHEVDWNAEAAEAAESYMDLKGFSRQGLIDQLESEYGEGFTHKQAVYGADSVGL